MQFLYDHRNTVNADKSVLGADVVNFDGIRFSANGVSPIDSHTVTIHDMKPPSNTKMLHSWLEATGYYMWFNLHYADLMEPPRQLLHKDAAWVWSRECQVAFDIVINQIVPVTSLALFDVYATTVVTTDASAVAIASCLSIIVNGEEWPVNILHLIAG